MCVCKTQAIPNSQSQGHYAQTGDLYMTSIQSELMAISNRMPHMVVAAAAAAAGQKLGTGGGGGAGGAPGGAGAPMGRGADQFAMDKASDFHFLQNVHFPELRNTAANHQQQLGGPHLPSVSTSAHLLQQQHQQQQVANTMLGSVTQQQQQQHGGSGHVPADFNHLLPAGMSFIDMALQTKEFQYY